MRDIRSNFDTEALMQAFVAEANSFNAASAEDSLPRQLLSWASEHMSQPHLVFDEACTSVSLDDELAHTIVEVVLLDVSYATSTREYRGVLLRKLFKELRASERGNRKFPDARLSTQQLPTMLPELRCRPDAADRALVASASVVDPDTRSKTKTALASRHALQPLATPATTASFASRSTTTTTTSLAVKRPRCRSTPHVSGTLGTRRSTTSLDVPPGKEKLPATSTRARTRNMSAARSGPQYSIQRRV